MLVVGDKEDSQKFTQFIDKDKQIQHKFLNGYRNRLTEDLHWVLQPDNECAGQGFCYPLIIMDEEVLNKLQKYEDEKCKIQRIANNFVVVSKPYVKIITSAQLKQIGQQKINSLRSVYSHLDQAIVDGIMLNVFNSYEEYEEVGLNLLGRNEDIEIQDEENLNKYKKFAGDNVFIVSKVDKVTGHWKPNPEILIRNNKKQEKQKEWEKQQVKQIVS